MVKYLRRIEYMYSRFYIAREGQLTWEGIIEATCHFIICFQKLRLCDFKIFLKFYWKFIWTILLLSLSLHVYPFLLILLPRKLEKNNSSTDIANSDFGKELLLIETVTCETVGTLVVKYSIWIKKILLCGQRK